MELCLHKLSVCNRRPLLAFNPLACEGVLLLLLLLLLLLGSKLGPCNAGRGVQTVQRRQRGANGATQAEGCKQCNAGRGVQTVQRRQRGANSATQA